MPHGEQARAAGGDRGSSRALVGESLPAPTGQSDTVILIEHDLDVIKTADWLLDLEPEGGVKGDEIVAEGTPEVVAKAKGRFTGRHLEPLLEKGGGVDKVAAE